MYVYIFIYDECIYIATTNTHYYLTLRNAIYIIKVIYAIFLHTELFLDFFSMQILYTELQFHQYA